MAVRTGIGYDSHRLVAGRRLVLGGVELASEVGLARDAGYAVTGVDATIVLETPRLGEARQAIRERLADALGLPAGHVNVKATSGEGIGFVGRGEGVAALAIATLDG